MRAISRRLCRLEGRLGVVENDRKRQEREFAETLQRRILAGRVRAGHSESSIEEVSGLIVEERLLQGRQRAWQAAVEAR